MADKEFEEFRQFFEQLPQHIKAPSNCYTEAVEEDVIQPKEAPRVSRQQANDLAANGHDFVPDLLTQFEPENIYIAGKMALYYNYLPENCKAHRLSNKNRGRSAGKTDVGKAGVCNDPSKLAPDRDRIVQERRKSSPDIKGAYGEPKQNQGNGKQDTKVKTTRICGRELRMAEEDDSIVQRMKLKLEEKIANQNKAVYSKRDLKRKPKHGKTPKKLLTILFATNMLGTEKLPLLVIGSSHFSKTFSAAKTLPTAYQRSKDGALTTELVEGWLRKHDETFAKSNKKIALIVDNSMKGSLKDLKVVKLVTPPGQPSKTYHPIEIKIAHELKLKYKLGLLDKWFRSSRENKDLEISILDALYFLKRAWTALKPSKINQAFVGSRPDSAGEDIPTIDFVAQCGVEIEHFNEWMAAEDDVKVKVLLTEEEILASVEKHIVPEDKSITTKATEDVQDVTKKVDVKDSKQDIKGTKQHFKEHQKNTSNGKSTINNKDNDNDSTDDEEAARAFLPPNGRQMRAACSALQSYIMSCPVTDDLLSYLAAIENFCIHHDIATKVKNSKSMK